MTVFSGTPSVITTACLLCFAFAACGKTGDTDTSRPATTDSVATPPTVTAFRPGIRFDPAALRPGTRVGDFVAESVSVSRAVVDSTFVGTARFRGQIQLTGWTLLHPDPDMKTVASCFEADSVSASRLPRWSGDERRPWFCFANATDATRALGPPSEGVPATIVIESFTIHRGLSDQVNSARFLRRVQHNTMLPAQDADSLTRGRL